MTFKLPPLNSLRLFECAARHRSFRAAAEELCVTPSAVSHGIKTLEGWMRTELFLRSSAGLSINPAAEKFLSAVQRALNGLSEATERLPSRKATGTLSLSVAPTFASRWLLPRLSSFAADYPNIVIAMDTSQRRVVLQQDGIDLAIRLARNAKTDGIWTPLVEETLVPVCAPSLYEGLKGKNLLHIFRSAPLIAVTSVGDEWQSWFSLMGISLPDFDASFRVDTVQLALEAAARGLGVALGRTPLVDDELKSGRLIALTEDRVVGVSRYWLVSTPTNFERPEIAFFRRWIVSELAN